MRVESARVSRERATNKIPKEIFCHTAAEVVGLDRGPEGGVHAPNVKRRRVADADAVAVAVTVA